MSFFRSRSPWPGLLAIVTALGLLGAALAWGRRPLRDQLRDQLARRDATVLAALLQKQLDDSGARDAGDPLVAVLDTAGLPGLPGVHAARLLTPDGTLFATLIGSPSAPLPSPELIQATRPGSPGVRYLPGANPSLELVIALRDDTGESIGLAALSLDGAGLAAEYERLDATFARQGWLAFGTLGGVMAAVLGLVFRRFNRLQLLVEERSHRLERANRELTLAAKTSAVGAVASHLVHGLRNPLAALQGFMAQDSLGTTADQADAAATARRMQSMIDDVVRVLRDEQGLAGYEIGADELCGELQRRLRPRFLGVSVTLEAQAAKGPPLDNRSANLALLILENLVTNAQQAIPGEGRIRVDARWSPEAGWQFRISDTGPGLAAEVVGRLFTPQNSTKAEGTGLGLALSHQLARHLGGDLRLERTGAQGSTFLLELPAVRAAFEPQG